MTNPQKNNTNFFLGIMVLKGDKWSPHSKLAGDELGRALMQAEEADKAPGIDGAKIVRISKKSGAVDKEMWVSPRVQARVDAAKSKQLRAGIQKTNESLSAARKAPFKKT